MVCGAIIPEGYGWGGGIQIFFVRGTPSGNLSSPRDDTVCNIIPSTNIRSGWCHFPIAGGSFVPQVSVMGMEVGAKFSPGVHPIWL